MRKNDLYYRKVVALKKSISVIVPVFNRKELVGMAIESLLRQTVRDEMEVVVIDDGSTDGTAEVLKKYASDTVRIFANGCNEGIVASRNRGLREAQGDYIAMLDSDDWAVASRLEKQRNFLEKYTDHGAVGSWINVVDGRGCRHGISRFETDANEIACALLFHNVVNGSTVMLRREALPSGGYDPTFPVAEEYRLVVDLQRNGWKIANIPEPLIGWLLHDGKISFERREAMEDCTRRIIAEQLSRLGIDYSDEEMAMHRALIMNRNWFDSEQKLSTCERLLVRIVEANRQAGLLHNEKLQLLVARLWFKVCRDSKVFSPRAYKLWYSSSLATISCLPLKDRISFTAVRFVQSMTRKEV